MTFPSKTMGIAVASHKVGYVVLRNGVLVDWYVSRAAAKSPERIQKVVRGWLDQHQPDLVISETFNPYSRKSDRTLALMQAAQATVKDAGIKLKSVPRTRNFNNKYDEITHLCSLYPIIAPWAPAPRKCWEGERLNTILFEALSLVEAANE